MPHGARKVSESGYYHVVPKGRNEQIIFESDEDRQLFINLLRKGKERTGALLHAYCLMDNHVHLIVEPPDGRLADLMKYVDERYGTYFAEKTGRTGGILRMPFWSEPIENDGHLLCAVRYVHANPAVAGICRASEYRWSSVRDYLDGGGITDTQTVLEMLGGREGFIEWSRASNSTALPFPSSKLRGHLSDTEALELAKSVTGLQDVSLVKLDSEQRKPIVRLLKDGGFSARQLKRLTGLSLGEISRS